MTELSTQKPLITEVFIDGARRGWDLATKSMLPNLVMAFVLIKVLTVSGLLNYIGMAFEPIMSIFGLPGESAMILVSAWMSSGGAIGVLLAFLSDGVMNGEQAAIILPSIFIRADNSSIWDDAWALSALRIICSMSSCSSPLFWLSRH